MLTKKTLNIPEWPSYSFDLNLLENYGKAYKWLSSDDQQTIWQSLKNFEKNDGQMLHNPGVESS
jgi:hypothetical protein